MNTNRTRSYNGSEEIDPVVVSYAVVGMSSIITNTAILATLLSDKKLLTNSALVAGFAVSHLLLGTNIGISGIARLINRAVLNKPMSPLACLRMVYPIAYPLAFQSSALLLCLTGVERLAAVAVPFWYRRWLAKKKVWYLVALIFILVSISLAIALSLVPSLPPTTRQCSQPGTLGDAYTSFGRLASACGGTVAVVLTIAAMFVGARRIRKMPLLSGEAGRMKKQIQLTKAMLGVAFVDFCLVVVPNTISFISVYRGIDLPSFMGATQSNVAFCVNAMSAVFLYLIFNSQFRHAAVKLFHLKSSNTVQAVTVGIEIQPLGSKEKNVTRISTRRI